MAFRLTACLLAATALFAQPRFDAPVAWVTPAAAATRTVYAYSAGHLFRTLDNGQSWDALSVAARGTPQPELVNLLVTPISPNVIYAFGRVRDGAVWKSLDYGDSWQVIDFGFRPTSDPVADAIIDATNPATMVARVGAEAYRTGNAGASWSSIAVLQPAGPYFALIASPASRRILYYATSGEIFRTDNEGATFRAIYSAPGSRPLVAVAVDRLTPEMLLAHYSDAEGSVTVRSYDSGLHWSPIDSPGPLRKLVIASGSAYYAVTDAGAVARTLNAGTTWQTGAPGFATNLAVDPIDERTVYAAGAGVHRSTDGGATFTPMAGTVRPNFTRPTPFPFRIRSGATASIDIPVRALENPAWSLPFEASVSEPWAVWSASSGAAPAVLKLTIDTTRLAPGAYTAQARLSSVQAAAPLTFPISITVEPPGPSAPPFSSSTAPAAVPGSAAALDGTLYLARSEPPAVLRVVNGVTTTYLTESNARAAGATSFRPQQVRFDLAGRLLIAASGSLLRVSPSSNPPITVLATAPPGGSFADVAAEPSGDLLILDSGRSTVLRRSAATGALSVIAGHAGIAGFAGDGGPAPDALLDSPRSMVRDTDGSLYLAESLRVRVITPDGLIFSIPVTGGAGSIQLDIDAQGNLLVSYANPPAAVKLTPLRTLPAIFGVVNAASNRPFLSPGSLFAIFGANLSDAGVTFNGTPARVLFSGRDQVNGQVPYEVAVGAATVSVASGGLTSLPATVAVLPASPGIFTTGPGHASAVNSSGAVNSEIDPAEPGEFIAVYLTGIGRVEPPVASGATTPAAPQSSATAPSRITLAGRNCEIRSVSLVASFTGLAQAIFRVPPEVPPGEHTLLVTVAGVESTPALISVGPMR